MAPREHLGGHFGISGAPWNFIFAPRDHLGGPWEQHDGHEVGNNRKLVDLGVISGPLYVSLLDTKWVNIICISRLGSRSFFYQFLTRMFDVWDFQIVFFALKVLQKSTLHENRV